MLLQPVIMGRVIDAVSRHRAIELPALLGLMLGLTLLMGLLGVVQTRVATLIRESVVKNARVRMFRHYLDVRFLDMLASSTGEIANRLLADIDAVGNSIQFALVPLISSGIVLAGAILVMYSQNALLATIAVAGTTLAAIPLPAIGRRLRALRTDASLHRDDIESQVHETMSVQGILLVKGMRAQERDTSRFAGACTSLLNVNVSAATATQMLQSLVGVLNAAGPMATICFGAFFTVHAGMTVGQLVAFVSLQAMLNEPINRLTNVHAQIASMASIIDRIFELLSLPQEDDGHDEAGEHAITFSNVSFSYPDSSRGIRNVSLQIDAGETVAIIGASGSGKSTIAQLLVGLFAPDGGKILVGGKPIETLRRRSLRETVLVVQEPYLHNTSIAKNLLYANPSADTECVRWALDASGAEAIVNHPEKGLDFIVGERGSKLSNGERQRVALARALVRSAKILILDEALSAVDAAAEAAALQKIRNNLGRDVTIICITHRLTGLSNFDRVFVMQDGRVIQDGTPAHLLAAGGAYRTMLEDAGLEKTVSAV